MTAAAAADDGGGGGARGGAGGGVATAAETAHAAAQAAGLELLRADDNQSGFRNVKRTGNSSKPWGASVMSERPGANRRRLLRPPEEAALAVARKLGPKGIAKVKAAEAAAATLRRR